MVGDIDRCLDADEERVQHHILLVAASLQFVEGDGPVAVPVPSCPVQFPEVTGISNKIQNVSSIPLSPNYFWNFWEWKVS